MRGENEKSIEEKQFALVAKVYYGQAYSTDLIGHIRSANKPAKKKSHADWTNWHILEK